MAVMGALMPLYPGNSVQVCPLLSSIVRDDIEFTLIRVRALS